MTAGDWISGFQECKQCLTHHVKLGLEEDSSYFKMLTSKEEEERWGDVITSHMHNGGASSPVLLFAFTD